MTSVPSATQPVCPAARRPDRQSVRSVQRAPGSADDERLVGLDAEPPAGMGETVLERATGVLGDVGPAGCLEAAAVRSDADEVGVAEGADGAMPVTLAPRPEVATGEAVEDGGAARVRAFALESVENLLDRIRHREVRPGAKEER